MKPQTVRAHPGASSSSISRRMSTARRKDTAPELALRRELHALGLRYRVTYPIPGQKRRTIDIAFTRARVAVFVDGCFWHGCPDHGNQPRSNSDWWREKLAAIRARDADTNQALQTLGWVVLRFWEHEKPLVVASAVRELVSQRRMSMDTPDEMP
ncbi:very short patch repair endonuclease [Promicromonospora soli]